MYSCTWRGILNVTVVKVLYRLSDSVTLCFCELWLYYNSLVIYYN